MRFIDPVGDGVGMRRLTQAPQNMASEMSDSRMHHGTLDSLSPLHPALLEVAGTEVFKPLSYFVPPSFRPGRILHDGDLFSDSSQTALS